MGFHLITVGLLKNGPERELIDFYAKQIKAPLTEHQIDQRKYPTPADWQKQIDMVLPPSGVRVFLDETGKNLSSRELANHIENWTHTGQTPVCFVIGGADGFTADFKKRADLLLSFGKLTWPHMLARVMLVEQIYRAQQILKNHPYHRD